MRHGRTSATRRLWFGGKSPPRRVSRIFLPTGELRLTGAHQPTKLTPTSPKNLHKTHKFYLITFPWQIYLLKKRIRCLCFFTTPFHCPLTCFWQCSQLFWGGNSIHFLSFHGKTMIFLLVPSFPLSCLPFEYFVKRFQQMQTNNGRVKKERNNKKRKQMFHTQRHAHEILTKMIK